MQKTTFIPWQKIDPETLVSILEAFALREGTDYGEIEIPLSEKVKQLKLQLYKEDIFIVWSEFDESIDIRPKKEYF